MTNEVNRTKKKTIVHRRKHNLCRWLEIVFLARENWVPIHAVTCGTFRVWEERKIGPQCVRVATAFLFPLVCEYGAVQCVQLF